MLDLLKAVHRFRLFLSGLRCRLPGGYYILKPGGANRFDPYRVVGACIFNTFPADCDTWEESSMLGQNGDELDVPCYLQILGLEIRCDASDLAIYNSGV